MVAVGAPFLGRQFSPRLGGGGHGDRGATVSPDRTVEMVAEVTSPPGYAGGMTHMPGVIQDLRLGQGAEGAQEELCPTCSCS